MLRKVAIPASGSRALGKRLVRRAVVVGASLWLSSLFGVTVSDAAGLPPAADILRDVGFSDEDYQRAREGTVVERKMSEGSEHELAFGMALLVKAKPERFAELYRKAPVFEVISQVTAYGRISGDGVPADFAKVALRPNPEKEAKRYVDAEPGEELNLDAKEIAAFQALKPAGGKGAVPVKNVEQLVRQELLVRYQAYRAKGLAGIAPYERPKGAQRLAGDELLRALKGSAYLAKYFPASYDVLLNYPASKEKAKNAQEFFYWINIELFSRPTLVLMHRILIQEGEAYVAVERQFYASHDYNAMQQIVAAVPSQEGFLVFYAGRVSTDQVGGFGSSAKHPIARALAAPYYKEMFETIRAQAEKR